MAVREDMPDSTMASSGVNMNCLDSGCSLHLQRLENLGLLSCGIAHDIKNMLGVIAGNVDLVLQDMPQDHSMQEYVLDIANATEKLIQFSQQILDFAGGITFHKQQTDLNSTISDMTRLLNVVLPASTKVRMELSDPLPRLFSDPSQLAQLVMNLIMNARDAMGNEPGTLTLSSGVHANGTHLFLKVADTGHGMSDHVMQNIFAPFYTTRSKGKGLGLCVVRNIVQGHDGFIEVHSRIGEGSSFTVCLPL